MFYFIPSWYNEHRKWYDSATVFYAYNVNREFDDSVHQIKLFKNAKEDTSLIILNYTPNFRHFAYRQGLLGVDYLSVFDLIQDIGDVVTKKIDYLDLNWEEGLEYIYTPFLITAYKNNKKYANINFTDEGNIMFIDFFKENYLSEKLIFDDRGFLSSVLYYKNGIEKYQEYLNTSGEWQIREYLGTDKIVEINPKFQNRFKKDKYNDIEELILEVIYNNVITNMLETDTVVIAFDNKQNNLFIDMEDFVNVKKVISITEERTKLEEISDITKILRFADMIVVDNFSLESNLLDKVKNEELKSKIKNIPIYDTRLELGKSQRKKELIIYVLVDNHDENELIQLLIKLFEIIEKDDRVCITLGSYGAKYDEKKLSSIVDDILVEYFNERMKVKKKDEHIYENKLFDIEDNTKYVTVEYVVIRNELELIKALEYVRLILNLGEYPDMLTTITGISSGIPQINSIENQYVENNKNGLIIKNIDQLESVVEYYFNGLENWNKSLVYSVQQILRYTGQELVKEWKQMLEG